MQSYIRTIVNLLWQMELVRGYIETMNGDHTGDSQAVLNTSIERSTKCRKKFNTNFSTKASVANVINSSFISRQFGYRGVNYDR